MTRIREEEEVVQSGSDNAACNCYGSMKLGRLFMFAVCMIKQFSFQNTSKSAEILSRSKVNSEFQTEGALLLKAFADNATTVAIFNIRICTVRNARHSRRCGMV